MAGHGRGQLRPVDQPRRLADVCLRRDAREQAVHPRRYGAEGLSAAGPLSAVDGIRGCQRQRPPIPGAHLLARVSRDGRLSEALTGRRFPGPGARSGRWRRPRPGRRRRQPEPRRGPIGDTMRVTTIVFAVALSIAGAASAQEWDQFVSTKDGFKIDFPGQPKIAETTWMSEYGYMLPARVYTVDKGKEHYSMTVVDYNGIRYQQIYVNEIYGLGLYPEPPHNQGGQFQGGGGGAGAQGQGQQPAG